jgi:hypothetical protein
MTRDMFAEADQNVVNVARSLADMSEVLDSLGIFGGRFFGYDEGGKRYREALCVMRDEVYRKYCEAITRCFCIVGVGGEEAADYSREQFEKMFGTDRRAIMQFLDNNGRHPHNWSGIENDEFRQQMAEKIKKGS